jgi:Ca-activated chloride channel family protein
MSALPSWLVGGGVTDPHSWVVAVTALFLLLVVGGLFSGRHIPFRRRALHAALACAFTGAALYGYARFLWKPPDVSLFYKGEVYELAAPRMLALALLAPYFLWVTGRSLADLPWPQRALSLGLRILLVACLGLGLSRLVKTSESKKVCTVYLVDVSESIPDDALADAKEELDRALLGKPKDALVKLVTFAKRPQFVEIPEGATAAPDILRHEPLATSSTPMSERKGLGSATDIASALQYAYGLYPAGYIRRAVLLTDGVQTDGDLLSEASRAKQFGVTIHALSAKRPVPAEVAIRDIKIPDKLRVGEPFELRATIFSSRAQRGKGTLKQGEAINGLEGIKEFDLIAGENEVRWKSVAHRAGDVTYQLELSQLAEDRFVENNRYTVVAAVPGRPQVLYVEGNQAHARYLSGALTAQELEVDVRSPTAIPTSLKELESYDFMILSDTPADKVSLTQQEAIASYVRELGGGLLFAGGERGYQLGGWNHTTIEKILPVRMDSTKRRDEPSVAMCLILDRSGSMQGLPIEMAKAAARAAADALQPDDLIEIVAFDSRPTKLVRMTPARHRARIQADISRLTASGGTEIFSALDMAYESLRNVKAKKKHAILLTDGQASTTGIRDLVQSMSAEGITVSSVGLGSGIDEGFLTEIAQVGLGRFHKVPDPQNLPRIFTRETELVSREAAVQEYFQPKVVNPADFLRGVPMHDAPFLHGYVATQMKGPPAQEVLTSEIQEPILARWRVGLGWTLAWTSDVKHVWAVEWLRWPGYGQFFGQLVREHMRQKKRQVFDMRAELDPAKGTVRASIDAIGGDDSFQNGLDARLVSRGPQPSGKEQKLPMKQTARRPSEKSDSLRRSCVIPGSRAVSPPPSQSAAACAAGGVVFWGPHPTRARLRLANFAVSGFCPTRS